MEPASKKPSEIGAQVVLKNLGTGDEITAEQGDDVQYRFQRVEPGVYSLVASAPGYEESRPKTLRVKAGSPARLAIHLEEGVEVLMGEIAAPTPVVEEPTMEESDPQ